MRRAVWLGLVTTSSRRRGALFHIVRTENPQMKKACPRSGRICDPGCTACQPRGQHGTRNPQRNLTAHVRWARALKRAHPYCAHCRRTDKLDAHHQPDGTGIVLCNDCHCAGDPYARPR